MSKSEKATAPAVIETAPADVSVVSTRAERTAHLLKSNEAILDTIADQLRDCKGWQDFGAIAASRMHAQGVERALFIAYAKLGGVDFTNDPALVKAETRDAICAGIRDQYIATEPTLRYRRGEKDALLVMAKDDPRPADVTVSATAACVPHTSIAHLKTKDKALWEAMTAFRKRIDGRVRVMYSSFFDAGRAQRKGAQVDALYSADEAERVQAEKEKSDKSATRAKAKPLNIAALAALIDNVIDQIDTSVKARVIKAPLAQAVADHLIAARAATGIKAKA